jgi:nucleotide-binding universal stress UspA family protein
MFEKVLVCLDGSSLAEQILPYIREESRCFRRVVLLKVVSRPAINLPIGIPGGAGVPVQTNAMLQRFEKELAEALPYLETKAETLKKKDLDVECVVLEGLPSEAIVQYAHDNHVKIIAIATHGHSGFRQITVGSTAEYLLRHAGLPILLVTPQKAEKR